jgi:hypothetical protein
MTKIAMFVLVLGTDVGQWNLIPQYVKTHRERTVTLFRRALVGSASSTDGWVVVYSARESLLSCDNSIIATGKSLVLLVCWMRAKNDSGRTNCTRPPLSPCV